MRAAWTACRSRVLEYRQACSALALPWLKRGPAPKLLLQPERISASPKPHHRAVTDVIEAVQAQQGH
ncbi:MAG: hypothetical protein ACOVOT_16565 [Rubrivivax sp.]|jgi:hypothetical protein|nr:hypothetical protein [Rubrivivax sp.]